jgi:ubiquinone/menaquinone biosynthesis C-methylase UbiE
MKIPFYQTEWLGIKLKEVAEKVAHDPSKIAGTIFYDEIYKAIFAKASFSLDKKWLERKKNLSHWLQDLLEKNISKDAAVLSVGCGFGVVELPLIQQGIKIDLQECQTHSIQYLERNHLKDLKKSKFILSQDLSNIPTSSYDVVLAITSTYCLDDQTLLSFLLQVKRILKENGKFIWYETALTLEDISILIKERIINFILNKKNKEHVFWGWKRSIGSQALTANKYELKMIQSYYLNQDNFEVLTKKIFGLPSTSSIAWQVGIYKRL